jgi:hypothetical protein
LTFGSLKTRSIRGDFFGASWLTSKFRVVATFVARRRPARGAGVKISSLASIMLPPDSLDI